MTTHSEREKEEEIGMPNLVDEDSKTKTIMAKVVPSKGFESYAVEVANRAVECLGHRKIITRSDSEPAILTAQGGRQERL